MLNNKNDMARQSLGKQISFIYAGKCGVGPDSAISLLLMVELQRVKQAGFFSG